MSVETKYLLFLTVTSEQTRTQCRMTFVVFNVLSGFNFSTFVGLQGALTLGVTAQIILHVVIT